jgi:hypothetical protein
LKAQAKRNNKKKIAPSVMTLNLYYWLKRILFIFLNASFSYVLIIPCR